MPKNTNLSKKHVAHLEQVRRQTQAIKISAIVLIVLVVGLVSYGVLINTVFLPDRPVASVNGEWVTVREFQIEGKSQRLQLINQISQYMQYAQMFGVSDPMNDQNFGPVLTQDYNDLKAPDQLGQKVLDLVITSKLIRQEAKKRNIVVSTADIDKSLQEKLGYFANGTLTPTPTILIPAASTLNPTQLALVTISPTPGPVYTETATVTPTLDPSMTPTITQTPTATATEAPTSTITPTPSITPSPTAYTLQGYQDVLKQELDFQNKQAGLPESDYRSLYEADLYRQKLQEIVVADLKPVVEEVWARHILVDTEADAQKVLARLNKGEDFSKLAAELSKDTGSGAKGGDIGWFGRTDDPAWQGQSMVKEFEDAAFALKVGEISQPVKSQFGYHIIQVLGHENRPMSAEDFQKYQDKFFTDYLKKLRDASKVETYDLWKEVVPSQPALPAQLEQALQPQQPQQPIQPQP